ncbi:OmpP1/FadL family transporter [Agarivorans albus]|uniref:Long-chain fatty acid transport protein n=1 Tax=Agarivorans albus MKT 106 TaxID=1331007 RepID=R9PK31_AGAAL|nr:outer membrane protein transport protein [Agarivorans albus]GAD01700.1 long-chain fatty acid transport protein [Agarivorans albus MKT 106]
MNKNLLALAISSMFASHAMAGGILLHEVATFDSVSSAGVSNPTNNKDASAAITSPAGLSYIEESSFTLGIQYLDAYSKHVGQLPNTELQLSTYGENKSFVPSLAYATRLDEQWVIAASLHGDGGLGMDYQNGRAGLGIINLESQEALNLHLAAAYQVNDKLHLGGALVVQHLMTSVDLNLGDINANGDVSSTAASFIFSGMYQLNPQTLLSANYKHRVDHQDTHLDLDVSNDQSIPLDVGVVWPSRLDLGISHSLSNQFTVKAMTGVEKWSDFNSAELDANNVFSVGTALAYQANDWVYQAGVRYDSPMFDTEDMVPELTISQNWSAGIGAEKTRRNGHRFGVAYEYRHLGNHDVNYSMSEQTNRYSYFDGRVTENRIHVLSFSYAY